MAKRNKFPIKMLGNSNWLYNPEEVCLDKPVKRAILKSEREFVLQCGDGVGSYDVQLRSDDGIRFFGSFSGTKGSKSMSVTANAELFSNENGQLLMGKWIEDGWEHYWWVTLNPVDSFEIE